MTIYNGIAHFVEVAGDPDADLQGQIQQIFSQAEASLRSFGRDLNGVLSVTI